MAKSPSGRPSTTAWGCFDEKGHLHLDTLSDTPEAAISAYIGPKWIDQWVEARKAGCTCEMVEIISRHRAHPDPAVARMDAALAECGADHPQREAIAETASALRALMTSLGDIDEAQPPAAVAGGADAPSTAEPRTGDEPAPIDPRTEGIHSLMGGIVVEFMKPPGSASRELTARFFASPAREETDLLFTTGARPAARLLTAMAETKARQ